MARRLKTVFFGCCDEFSDPFRVRLASISDLVGLVRTTAELNKMPVPVAELAVVASFGAKLSDAVIATYPLGVINMHPSLLPRYRGAAPAEWQLLRRERESGVTAIRLSSRMDAGAILDAEPFAIGPHTTRSQLLREAATRGVDLLSRLLRDVPNSLSRGVAQREELATRAPKVNRDMTIVDWHTWTVEEFRCRFNALSERFEGLYVTPRIKVTEIGDPVMGDRLDPMKRFNKRENYIGAQLVDGWVPLRRFRVAASAPMDARDIWNGHRDTILKGTPPFATT